MASCKAELRDSLLASPRVRVHLRDGEVLVARVLFCDDTVFGYSVETSSMPERYGVCDSTGWERPLSEVERVTPLRARPIA